MKFYKFTLSLMLTILIAATLITLFSVHVAFKKSEAENNRYYSEIAYRAIHEYTNVQLKRIHDGVFSDEAFKRLQASILYNADNLGDVFTGQLVEYYYFENPDLPPTTNMSPDLIQSFYHEATPLSHTQLYVMTHENQLYLGVYKNVHVSTSENTKRTFLALAPIERVFDFTGFDHLIHLDKITYHAHIDAEDFLNYVTITGGGLLSIEHSDYNTIFVPIQMDDLTYSYVSIQLPKPAIIDALRTQMYVIIILVFGVFVMSSIGATYILRRISKHLTKTIVKVDEIANGNYNQKIESSYFLEMQILENSIYKMAETIEDKIETLKEKNTEILHVLIHALDETDAYTKGHSDRVAELAVSLGKSMAYENLEELKHAALLHDIGKISVPEQILNKKERLTEYEFEKIKKHPVTGFNIIKNARAFKTVAPLILHHHEKYDGSGYPHQLVGEAIPLGAQILSIADVYDALTTNRPYRPGLSHKEAMRIITEEMSAHYSVKLMQAFQKLMATT